ncbi:MAG: hypothetical protein WD069_19175 [Planctomycetales bacterium]
MFAEFALIAVAVVAMHGIFFGCLYAWYRWRPMSWLERLLPSADLPDADDDLRTTRYVLYCVLVLFLLLLLVLLKLVSNLTDGTFPGWGWVFGLPAWAAGVFIINELAAWTAQHHDARGQRGDGGKRD